MSESLSIGVPCICSNVCKREDAAILFESRNQYDFNGKVTEVLSNLELEKEKLKNIKIQDNYTAILSLYINLINRKR